MSATDVLDLVEGFLEGAVAAEGLTDLATCIKDIETIIPEAEKTYSDCMTSNLDSKLECVKDMADLTNEAKNAVSDCESVKGDIEKLEKIISTFSSPASFAWHLGKDLLVNGVNIYKDIEDAIDAYNAQNWKKFGNDIGSATALVILGAEEPVYYTEEIIIFEDEQTFAEMVFDTEWEVIEGNDEEPCCNSCEAPFEKYYSIDHIFHMCGEACMHPKDFWKYKIFEPGLTKDDSSNTPCADREFTLYHETATHGAGPIKMTLDLYKKESKEAFWPF